MSGERHFIRGNLSTSPDCNSWRADLPVRWYVFKYDVVEVGGEGHLEGNSLM